MGLLPYHTNGWVEAGCDEAGRGCLAGPVFAAAVILPQGYKNPGIMDSKKLSEKKRYLLREEIEKVALSFCVAQVSNIEIDRINIFKAAMRAMHLAIDGLKTTPQLLLIDGHLFIKHAKVPHVCVVQGDNTYCSIAAASILAKTYRDDFMKQAHCEFPYYCWDQNKGYGTKAHCLAIKEHGISPYHRKTFKVADQQLKLNM
jgi:ribonuclease HII